MGTSAMGPDEIFTVLCLSDGRLRRHSRIHRNRHSERAMKEFSNRSMLDASAAQAIHGSDRVSGRLRRLVAHSPDTMADVYSHLRWIGPGTFLVAAYIHKRSGA